MAPPFLSTIVNLQKTFGFRANESKTSQNSAPSKPSPGRQLVPGLPTWNKKQPESERPPEPPGGPWLRRAPLGSVVVYPRNGQSSAKKDVSAQQPFATRRGQGQRPDHKPRGQEVSAKGGLPPPRRVMPPCIPKGEPPKPKFMEVRLSICDQRASTGDPRRTSNCNLLDGEPPIEGFDPYKQAQQLYLNYDSADHEPSGSTGANDSSRTEYGEFDLVPYISGDQLSFAGIAQRVQITQRSANTPRNAPKVKP
jgi:hypothetical protein